MPTHLSALEQRTVDQAKAISLVAHKIARAPDEQTANKLSSTITSILRGSKAAAPPDPTPPPPTGWVGPARTPPAPLPPESRGPNDPATQFNSPNPVVIRALQNALSSLDPNDASVDPSDTSFPDPNKSIDCTRAFRQGSAVIVPEIDAVTVELKNQALTAQKRTELTAELDKLNLQFAKLTVAYTNCLGKVHKIS